LLIFKPFKKLGLPKVKRRVFRMRSKMKFSARELRVVARLRGRFRFAGRRLRRLCRWNPVIEAASGISDDIDIQVRILTPAH
jgi:hypothetical protein